MIHSMNTHIELRIITTITTKDFKRAPLSLSLFPSTPLELLSSRLLVLAFAAFVTNTLFLDPQLFCRVRGGNVKFEYRLSSTITATCVDKHSLAPASFCL